MAGDSRPGGTKISASAISRKMGVTPSYIHYLVKGKAPLSLERANEIADVVEMSRLTKAEFIRAVASSLAKKSQVAVLVSLAGKTESLFKFKEMDPSLLNELCQWYVFAVLGLMNCRHFKPDIEWMAKKLELNRQFVEDALDRLERTGAIERTPNGWQVKSEWLSFTQEFSFGQLAKLHTSYLTRAIIEMKKTLRDERSRRYISGTVLSVDPNKIADARKEIQRFRAKMSEFLSTSNDTEVYYLGVQLVPLTKKEDGDHV